jgi:hypothetical protein
MGWAFIPKSPGASERKIAMDWYREGDKIVLVNQRVRQGDVVLIGALFWFPP